VALRFGDIAVDFGSRQVRRGTDSVHLGPKAFDLLELLLRNRPRALSKAQLRDQLWPRTFTSESNLTSLVTELRTALGDEARRPRCIRTVYGFGYAFCGPVEELPDTTGPAAPGVARPRLFPEGREIALREGENPGSRPGTDLATAVRPRGRWLLAAAILVATAAAALVVAVWLAHRTPELPPPRVVPLTSMRGVEMFPTFSPDGTHVAFAWQGENLDKWDIYLKMVGSPEVRRLTTDLVPDTAPSWSPDGRQIAFACGRPESTATHPEGFAAVCLVSPLGGSARKLSDFPLRPGSPPSWSPDGRWLAADRAPSTDEPGLEDIYLLPVQGGEPRRLGLPKAARGVTSPSFSRDGRHLAYASRHGIINYSVDVVELSANYFPNGPPRRLTPPIVRLGGSPAWTRDGKSLVYADTQLPFALWRVGIAGDRPPERIEIGGREASMPATAASRDRLAFVRVRRNTHIERFEVGRPSEPVLESSFAHDYSPQFSPDGRRFAFASDRSGEGFEVWLAEADGSKLVQLTRGPGLVQGAPRWSPDGRRIVFDSLGADGRWDIWTIGADGGSPRRLTQGPGDEQGPIWSRDGRFVYFTANLAEARDGGPEVWRVRATGGPPERLTRRGGWHLQESLDGKTLFFHGVLRGSPLLALPIAGGAQRQVVDCVSSFTVGPAGIYYLACSNGPRTLGPAAPGRPPGGALFLLNPTTGRSRLLGQLEWAADWWGPTVSPDGRTIFLTKWVEEGGDLTMIEDFR
jgi:Tol biopolymer transport system component/DNA-binding winged helix-turn-helix (wHTH) protein